MLLVWRRWHIHTLHWKGCMCSSTVPSRPPAQLHFSSRGNDNIGMEFSNCENECVLISYIFHFYKKKWGYKDFPSFYCTLHGSLLSSNNTTHRHAVQSDWFKGLRKRVLFAVQIIMLSNESTCISPPLLNVKKKYGNILENYCFLNSN